MNLMKYVLTLATLILALTHESLAQSSVPSILERIISSEDNVITHGNVIEPHEPVFSLSGTYGNDDNLTYVVDYKWRGRDITSSR